LLAVALVGSLATVAVAQWGQRAYTPGDLLVGAGRLRVAWGAPWYQLQMVASDLQQTLRCTLVGNGRCACPFGLGQELKMFETSISQWRRIGIPDGNPQLYCATMSAGNPPARLDKAASPANPVVAQAEWTSYFLPYA
jgi:hypothetical protein